MWFTRKPRVYATDPVSEEWFKTKREFDQITLIEDIKRMRAEIERVRGENQAGLIKVAQMHRLSTAP